MKTKTKDYLVTIIGGTLIILLYAMMSTNLLPHGVNQVFVSRLWPRLLVLMVIWLVLLILNIRFFQNRYFSYQKKYEGIAVHDFVFCLIPLIPVIQYLVTNKQSFGIMESGYLFILFTIISVVFGVVIPGLSSFFFQKRVLISVAISYLYLLFGMASFHNVISKAEGGNSLNIQILIFVLAIFFVYIIFKLPRKITSTIILVYFIFNAFFSVVSNQTDNSSKSNADPNSDAFEKIALIDAVRQRKPVRKNNIIFLVFEAYAANRTLSYYGFDNSELTRFLEKNNFSVYSDIYSMGAATGPSLTRVFNVDSKLDNKKYLAGGAAVPWILKKFGYEIYGVFQDSFNFSEINFEENKYDYAFPTKLNRNLKYKAIFPNFFNTATRLMFQSILAGDFSDAVSSGKIDFDTYIRKKHEILMMKNSFGQPLFVYTHSWNPQHTSSGGISLAEGYQCKQEYFARIRKANQEIRSDVELLLKHNPDALIIIAGDHGPFLTKTGYKLGSDNGIFNVADIDRYDIQDRFSSFLAIRWPDEKYSKRYDIKILQDIFPAVFSFLFDDDTLFEKTRLEREIVIKKFTRGVYVKDGIIVGGKDDGEPLYINDNKHQTRKGADDF